MASPAPTGAPNAAMSSPAPQMSPGTMAPATTPGYGGQNSIKTSATPAPTGAPDAPQVTQPGMSPGNMAPGNSGMNASNGAHMKSSTSYNRSMMTGLPADADAKTYLHIAAGAIRQHNKMMADDALSHAETRMLTRAVVASAGAQPDESPAVTAIEHARQALSSGDYATAAADTKTAMHAHHGMMGAGGMGQMDGSDAMGGPAQ
jgi:hypothetical protein